MSRAIKDLKVIFCVSKYFGLLPFTLLNNGTLKFSPPFFLFSIGLVTSITLVILQRMRFYWRTPDRKIVIFTTFELQFTVSILVYSASVAIFLIQRKEFARIIEKVVSIHNRFSPLHLAKRFCYSRRWPVMLVLGVLSYSGIFALSYIYAKKAEIVFAYLVFFICFYSPYVMLIQFSCLTQFCCYCFAVINNEIMSLIAVTMSEKSSRIQRKAVIMGSNINITSSEIFEERNFLRGTRINVPEKMRSLAAIHGKLCDIITIINSVYSLPILFNIADIFVAVAVEMFGVYFIVCEYSSKLMFCSMLASISLWYLLKLVVVLHSCVTCSTEVSFILTDFYVIYS
jgi:hypothetical protein